MRSNILGLNGDHRGKIYDLVFPVFVNDVSGKKILQQGMFQSPGDTYWIEINKCIFGERDWGIVTAVSELSQVWGVKFGSLRDLTT